MKNSSKKLILWIYLLGALVLVSGCKIYDEVEDFEARVFLKVFTSFEVKIPQMEYLVAVSPLSSPPATWQNLVRFRVPAENSGADEIYCLSFQIPYEKMKILGEIRFEKANAQGQCQAGVEKNKLESLTEIRNLQFFLSDQKQLLKNEQKELNPYTLYLKFDRRGQEEWIELPLVNLEKNFIQASELSFSGHSFTKERYGHALIERYISGTLLLPYGKSERFIAPSVAIGSMNDSYIEGTAVRCHDVKPDCSEVKAYSCDECRYGWYEVSGSKCKGGYVKFCGPRFCGGKNQAACLRGTHFNQLSNLCFEGSNAAFCNEGLHTYCDENGILICK